ncbi:trafficking protein particle complex subunit 10-like [Pollicipes pollicipes]|uniref:trafficking protein particle complex subunit 10-like n=1 Tax=Pollicipes pollicipes TaxID=41117 RepID=UPI0018858D67|nr:trafficking protein particle complex subunit 10-like [Pollicipes pollicipes]
MEERGRKPVITYAGEPQVFRLLQNSLVHGLPQEEVEWRRSYGRPPRHVTLEATFEPCSEATLTDDMSTLVRRPCLHTFWTDCPDNETYKSSTRDSLQSWLAMLRQHNVVDWLVVVVEAADARSKANKLLPRSSVLDKVKADINSKHGDRCVTLLDPSKTDARSAGSLHNLLTKLRHFLLIGFNRVLVRFEDAMRSQREKRTSSNWSFGAYFPLQEELAFVFQQLGLCDEALVQYDELDALFTQFILNSCAGETPRWLEAFSQPVTEWHGLSVPASCSDAVRDAIRNQSVSLLAFRNYLYARQCVLLQALDRTAEIAQRTLNFLFNTINELRLMQLEIQPGGLACWAFGTCMNVLDICSEIPADTAAQEAVGVYTASLYDQARLKLYGLGELCGLLPGERSSSAQLHLMVTLSAGMGDSPAADKLKDALSSHDAFQNCYLELSELAMGTYKHMGRLRSARLVGRQLATFHLRLGQAAHAASLLTDALKTYQEEGWGQLTAQLLLQLAQCYQIMDDHQRYTQTCAMIAGREDVTQEARLQYAKQLVDIASTKQTRVVTSGDDLLLVRAVRLSEPDREPFPGARVEVVLDSCRADVQLAEPPEQLSRNTSSASTSSSGSSRRDTGQRPDSPAALLGPADDRLQLEENIEYKQDKSLSAATLICRNMLRVLRRKDSQPSVGRRGQLPAGAFDVSLEQRDVTLQPGTNRLTLAGQMESPGSFVVQHLQFRCTSLDLMVELDRALRFTVKSSPHKVSLNKAEPDLLAGTVQQMTVAVACGSEPMTQASRLRLQCSRGLTVRRSDTTADQWVEQLELPLPPLAAFQTVTLPVSVLSQLAHVKDGVSLLHKVNIFCPWSSLPVEAELYFLLPFSVNFRLHTAQVRKFVQVMMHGLNTTAFELTQPSAVVINDAPVTLTSLNANAESVVVCSDRSVSYLWEMGLDEATPPVRAQFCVDYRAVDADSKQRFKFDFTVADYRTLFSVTCRMEPLKGAEFCRSGSICQLHVTVTQEDSCADLRAVMYEVLADQNMWAVCGRSSGVLNMGPDTRHSLQLEVMPLTGGFLPLPTVRLSRYIPANKEPANRLLNAGSGLPRLEPFAVGQVYSASRGQQVHVLAATAPGPASSATDSSLT